MNTDTTLSEEAISELAAKGIIYGHKKSKTHPLMKAVIIDTRNEIEILSPEAVIDSLNRAAAFLSEKAKPGFLLLLVGTTAPARDAVLGFAKEFGFPHVTNRWLGGTLTNFSVIRKRNQYFEDLKTKKERGELTKYTKKEQLEFNREIEKMKENFEGLTRLAKLPDALFVVDIKEHAASVKEALDLNIPVLAIVDTDDDPSRIQYPIYASDHTKASIEWIMEKLKESLVRAVLDTAGQKGE